MTNPDEWACVGDHVSLVRGTTYKGALVGAPGPALLGLGSIEPGGGFRADFKTYGGECPEALTLRPGDIYASLKGATKDGKMIGSVARVPPAVARGRLTQDTVKLVFENRDPGLESFLYWILRTPQYRDYCAGRAMGSAVVAMSRSDFLAYPVPPRTAQREAMIRVLDALEQRIDLNRRMAETLESIARALFKSWFVDFDPVRAKAEGRETGLPIAIADVFSNGFESSAIGDIPAGWSVKSLAYVAVELETGRRPKGGVSEYSTGIPSIGAESIVGLGKFDFGKSKFVPEEYFRAMRQGVIKSRDVLLYKDGGRPGEFEPHVAMFGDGFPFAESCINEHVYRIRARDDYGQNLLYFWLSSASALEEMRIRGTGVAIPGLNSTQARALAVLVPPPAVAKAFDDVVEPFVARVLNAANESRRLADLRDALLPKLISGELRVPRAEALAEGTAA
jgi:type I restriction enzyme, S subunit